MNLLEAITQVFEQKDLSREEAAAVMREMMSGEASQLQTAAFLTALRMKGESVSEISGFAQTMREKATPIQSRRSPLVDTCGTGGDHSGTFNISTTSAFVVAGAGAAVAKHGNRSATSVCGSADVLEALGVNIDAGPELVGRCIDEIGIGFLFARALHGAMKFVGPVRAELGFRTVFNLLGPLTNPAGADRQMMGVFDGAWIRPVAEVLLSLGSRHVFVVSALDGLDELSLSGPSRVAEGRDGEVREYEIDPESLGFALAPRAALVGGSAQKNAEILRAVLQGATGPTRDVVLLNAAPAIVAAGLADDIPAGLACAQAAVDSGAALEKLESLIRLSSET